VPLTVQADDLIGMDFHGTGSMVVVYMSDATLSSASIAGFSGSLTTAAAPSSTSAHELMANFDVELAAPQIAQVTPSSGDGGTQVTINGQHLANATGVMFGSVAGTITSNTNDQIVVVAPPGNHGPVDVAVTTLGGSAKATFAYPSPAPPPAADTTAPVLSTLALAPKKFRAANIGGSVAVAVGGRVRYSVSEAGTVTFTVQRLVSGHRRGGRCRAGGHTGRRCTVVQTIKGSFGRTRAAAGQDQFRFTARVGGRSLKPGRYRLTAKARDAAGNASTASTATFTIVK
jgi:IPT/TIG domain-containing protein